MNTKQFTATAHSTVQEKQKFAEHFKRFVQKGFPRSLFPKWFYQRLSMCFGMIAHYNLDGFFNVYFACTGGKVQFVRDVLAWRCPGDPAYTYSDVEAHLQEWLREQGIQGVLQQTFQNEKEQEELDVRDRLIAKHGLPPYEIKREQA